MRWINFTDASIVSANNTEHDKLQACGNTVNSELVWRLPRKMVSQFCEISAPVVF